MAKRKRRKAKRWMTHEIPRTWLDPLLTGPKAVIGDPPYNCKDIERLLAALRARVARAEGCDDIGER